MNFHSQQVLRTKSSLSTEGGRKVRPGTRVVYVKTVEGKPVVKVADARFEKLAGARIITSPKSFEVTSRGRPSGTSRRRKVARAQAVATTRRKAH